jgi:hypothetical protein
MNSNEKIKFNKLLKKWIRKISKSLKEYFKIKINKLKSGLIFSKEYNLFKFHLQIPSIID